MANINKPICQKCMCFLDVKKNRLDRVVEVSCENCGIIFERNEPLEGIKK